MITQEVAKNKETPCEPPSRWSQAPPGIPGGVGEGGTQQRRAADVAAGVVAGVAGVAGSANEGLCRCSVALHKAGKLSAPNVQVRCLRQWLSVILHVHVLKHSNMEGALMAASRATEL